MLCDKNVYLSFHKSSFIKLSLVVPKIFVRPTTEVLDSKKCSKIKFQNLGANFNTNI